MESSRILVIKLTILRNSISCGLSIRRSQLKWPDVLLKNVFSVVSLPLILQHDNGKEFFNKVRTLPKSLNQNILLLLFYFMATDHSNGY